MLRISTVTMLLTVVAFQHSATAGTPYSIEWGRQYGTTSFDSGDSVAVDAAGNIFVTGSTNGNLDGQSHSGSSDAFLSKFDSSGSILWTRLIGTQTNEFGYDVAVDTFGNAVVVGQTWGNLAGSVGLFDGYVRKFDPKGNTVWTRQFGSTAIDTAVSITLDNAANIYVVGNSRGNINGQVNSGSIDAYLQKLDSNGVLQWSRQLGTSGADAATSVAINPNSGDVFFAGYSNGNFGGQPNRGSGDMALTKWDNAGNLQWARLLGTTVDDEATAVAADGDGNVYLAGYTYGNLGQPNNGVTDAVLAKYDTNGFPQWTRLFGTSSGDYALDITIDDNSDAIFMAGHTRGNLGSPNNGENDLFVAKWDAFGDCASTLQLGTTAIDDADSVITDPVTGSVYVTGSTQGSLFAPNAGDADVLVLKLTPEPANAGMLFIFAMTIRNRRKR